MKINWMSISAALLIVLLPIVVGAGAGLTVVVSLGFTAVVLALFGVVDSIERNK